jgi:hypothetical protein
MAFSFKVDPGLNGTGVSLLSLNKQQACRLWLLIANCCISEIWNKAAHKVAL